MFVNISFQTHQHKVLINSLVLQFTDNFVSYHIDHNLSNTTCHLLVTSIRDLPGVCYRHCGFILPISIFVRSDCGDWQISLLILSRRHSAPYQTRHLTRIGDNAILDLVQELIKWVILIISIYLILFFVTWTNRECVFVSSS